MRCGHPGGGMFSRACTLEQLHDGDHNNGKKTWPLGARDLERLAVQAIGAGDQDAAAHYTEGAALTMRAAFTGAMTLERAIQEVQRDIGNMLEGREP